MEEKNQGENLPQFFIVDSKVLQDKNLCTFDVVCYSLVCLLTNNEHNKCFATNQYLATVLNCSPRNIQRSLKNLSKNNYLKIEVENYNKRVIKTTLSIAIEEHYQKLQSLKENKKEKEKIEILNYDWLNEDQNYE